jgi:hypothetical protein
MTSRSKLSLCLLAFICFSVFVGTAMAQTYKQQADSVMLNLNKSALTTNILYDRVFPLAHLQDYTGLVGADTSN